MDTSKTRLLFFFTIFLLLVSSCNLYSPLEPESSAEALLEAAQKCLHEGDIDCAIEKYSALPAGAQREQKLCTGLLVKAGFTLSAFLNIVGLNQSNMLGTLAQTLVPWSSAKGTAAAEAYTHCVSYSNQAPGNLGVLLKTVGGFVDCASRISKADQYVATSNTDTACTTAGNRNGIITQGDIGASGGSISTSSPGMCPADVAACTVTFSELDQSDTSSELGSSDLDDIQGSFDQIPDALKAAVTGEATNSARSSIRDMLPSD